MAQALIDRILEGRRMYRVNAEGMTLPRRATFARVEVRGPERLHLTWAERGASHVGASREVVSAVEREPSPVWCVEPTDDENEAFITPFRATRRVPLNVRLPVHVHPSVAERLGPVGLTPTSDLLLSGGVKVSGDHFAVLGQRSIVATDPSELTRLTWWLPNGAALELRVDHAGDRARLHLEDVVVPAEAHKAFSGPNTLASVAPGAQVRFVPSSERDWGDARGLADLLPQTSRLFDAWARYAQIEGRVSEERLRDRTKHPLLFRKARQAGPRWVAEVELSAEASRAWLGDDPESTRRIRLSQTVQVAVPGEDRGMRFEIEDAQPVGPGQLRVFLRASGDDPRLPETGELKAVESLGDKTRRKREAEALRRLTLGDSACERLTTILIDPANASPVPTIALPQPLGGPLDVDQRRAVELIVGCQDLVAIQGPPGTGKTRVIVEAVTQLVAKHRGQQLRVLISSVQNEAVRNVVERLGLVEGVLVEVVSARGRDEDTALARSASRERQREGVVEALRRRVSGEPIVACLDALADAQRQVDELRALPVARLHEAHLRARIQSLIEQHSEVIGDLLASEARGGLFDVGPGDSPGGSASPPAEAGRAVAFPSSPEAVEAWWEHAGAHWPAESRAEMGMKVQAVRDATRAPEGPRRDFAIRRAWPAFQASAAALAPLPPGPPEPTGPAPEDSERFEKRRAWLATASRRIAETQAAWDQRPTAIALRLLRRLEADHRAWSEIVARHGNTVAATCSMAAATGAPGAQDYDWVIIDEAGRASPFELMIPMVMGKRVVLIGDHRQLPPTMDEMIVREAQRGVARSQGVETLFGEVFEALPLGCRTRLATQYRMIEDIGSVVSEIFYAPHNEALHSHFQNALRPHRLPTWGVFQDQPRVWLDVPSGDPPSVEESPRERAMVLRVLRTFLQRGARPDDLAIICAYGDQAKALKAAVDAAPELAQFKNVHTIDAVQGREYPAVLFCLTRADGRPGFLASTSRINVAISRAQRQLIVFGCREALRSRRMTDGAPHLVQLVEKLTANARRLEEI